MVVIRMEGIEVVAARAVTTVAEAVTVAEEADGADAKATRLGREDTGTTVVSSTTPRDEEVGAVEVDGVTRTLILRIRRRSRVDITCRRALKCITLRNTSCRRKCRNEIKFFPL
jgi:hypothetical protein